MPPTGIMIHLAKECGYDNVKDYLEKYVCYLCAYNNMYIASYSLWCKNGWERHL